MKTYLYRFLFLLTFVAISSHADEVSIRATSANITKISATELVVLKDSEGGATGATYTLKISVAGMNLKYTTHFDQYDADYRLAGLVQGRADLLASLQSIKEGDVFRDEGDDKSSKKCYRYVVYFIYNPADFAVSTLRTKKIAAVCP